MVEYDRLFGKFDPTPRESEPNKDVNTFLPGVFPRY